MAGCFFETWIVFPLYSTAEEYGWKPYSLPIFFLFSPLQESKDSHRPMKLKHILGKKLGKQATKCVPGTLGRGRGGKGVPVGWCLSQLWPGGQEEPAGPLPRGLTTSQGSEIGQGCGGHLTLMQPSASVWGTGHFAEAGVSGFLVLCFLPPRALF